VPKPLPPQPAFQMDAETISLYGGAMRAWDDLARSGRESLASAVSLTCMWRKKLCSQVKLKASIPHWPKRLDRRDGNWRP